MKVSMLEPTKDLCCCCLGAIEMDIELRAAGSVAWVKASCWSTSDPPKLAHRVENPKAWRYPE